MAWWDSEAKIRQVGIAHDAEVTAFGEDGIELFGIGFDLSNALKNPERWELVTALAVTNLFNSVRSAWELFFVGYYVQGLALLRTATDYLGLIWYIREHPDEAEDWLDFSKEQRKSAGKMLDEVFAKDKVASELFHDVRELLRHFAHQDTLALGLVYEEGAPSSFAARVGPHLDPRAFANSSYFMVVVTGLAVHAFREWIERLPAAASWNRAVEHYLERIAVWSDKVGEKTGVPPA